jgi:hypothetical protein
MRDTTVASVCGTQSRNVSVPSKHGTPATQILSFKQTVLPFKIFKFGESDESSNRQAHAPRVLSSGLGKRIFRLGCLVVSGSGW